MCSSVSFTHNLTIGHTRRSDFMKDSRRSSSGVPSQLQDTRENTKQKWLSVLPPLHVNTKAIDFARIRKDLLVMYF